MVSLFPVPRDHDNGLCSQHLVGGLMICSWCLVGSVIICSQRLVGGQMIYLFPAPSW